MKYAIISAIAATLIIVALLCFYSSKRRMDVVESVEKPPEILFIPGFKSKHVLENEYKQMLKSVFPDSAIEVMKWESNVSVLDWPKAVELADLSVSQVLDKIGRMEAEKRENLVLVGHSLGGRMVIRTLAKLADKNIRIRRGIFLAAAIPDDDQDIQKAVKATKKPCINIFNREDQILRTVYGIVGENNSDAVMKGALGAYGCRKRLPSLALLEFKLMNETGNKTSHDAQNYFVALRSRIRDAKLASCLFPPMRVRRGSLKNGAWKEIRQKDGWKLCRHDSTGQYKVESPWGNLVMMDDSDVILSTFEHLEENLASVGRYNELKITVENGVAPVKVIPVGLERMTDTLGFKWETEEECEGWLLQRKEIPLIKEAKTYRLVDDRDILRAQGDKDSLKRSFKKIKEQLKCQ